MIKRKDEIKPRINEDELLSNAADKLVSNIAEIMRRAKTEEDLRIGFEKSLEPILKGIGIEPRPIYESLGIEKRAIYRGRPDAIHGKIIIEYEPPNAFGSESAVIHAYDQLKGYIIAKAKGEKTDFGESLKRIIGIGFDGKSIFFVKYLGKIDGKIDAIDEKLFIRQGPLDINQDSCRTLLTYLRAIARLPLSAKYLADKFGPKSKIAPIAVSAFVDSLEHWGNERTKVFFNEWKRLFGIVYGEQFSAQRAEEARILSKIYGINKEIDFQKLLFSVHTYFALLMKFIAAEIINLKESALAFSYSHQLTHSSKNELLEQLTYIENGGIYAK